MSLFFEQARQQDQSAEPNPFAEAHKSEVRRWVGIGLGALVTTFLCGGAMWAYVAMSNAR